MIVNFNRSVNALRVSHLAPLTRNAGFAWRWWLDELWKMLPENLRQIVASANQRLVVSTDGDEFIVRHGSAKQFQEIGRISSANENAPAFAIPDDAKQCTLLLPREWVLTRTLTLPLAAEENLREVLSFEMDRHTPFAADQVYYDYVINRRSPAGKNLSLQLFVAPRPLVDEAMARLSAAGIQPDVTSTHAPDGSVEESINLLPADKRYNRDTLLRRMNLSLAVLAILLVTTAIIVPLLQKGRMIRTLEAEVQVAAIAAEGTSQLRQEVEKLVEGSRYLVNKKRTEPTTVELLDEMTGIIPDHTWVNRIDIDGGEIQLHGQSGSAAELIALIETSETFGNAQFRSPLTQVVRTDEERFHIAAEVLPGQEE
jgi:general secretion pathway protein L